MSYKTPVSALLVIVFTHMLQAGGTESLPTHAEISELINRHGMYPKPLVFYLPATSELGSWECNALQLLAETGYLVPEGDRSSCRFEVHSKARVFIKTNYDYNYTVTGYSVHLGRVRAGHTHEGANLYRIVEHVRPNPLYDIVLPYLPTNVKSELIARTYKLKISRSDAGLVAIAEVK